MPILTLGQRVASLDEAIVTIKDQANGVSMTQRGG
jgi:hypothetical protein